MELSFGNSFESLILARIWIFLTDPNQGGQLITDPRDPDPKHCFAGLQPSRIKGGPLSGYLKMTNIPSNCGELLYRYLCPYKKILETCHKISVADP
jgi:hypothetical protein